ncbi:hypothetical protein SCA6_008736 [Theobroma cacao]
MRIARNHKPDNNNDPEVLTITPIKRLGKVLFSGQQRKLIFSFTFLHGRVEKKERVYIVSSLHEINVKLVTEFRCHQSFLQDTAKVTWAVPFEKLGRHWR